MTTATLSPLYNLCLQCFVSTVACAAGSLNQEVWINGLLKPKHTNVPVPVFILGYPGTPYSDPVPPLHWAELPEVKTASLGKEPLSYTVLQRGKCRRPFTCAGSLCQVSSCHHFICCLCLWRTRSWVLLLILHVYSWVIYTLSYPFSKIPWTQTSLFILYYAQLSEKQNFLLCLRNTFQLFIQIKNPLHCVPHFLHKQLMCSFRYAGFKGIYFISHTLDIAVGMVDWEDWQPFLQWELIIPKWDNFFVMYSVGIWHDRQMPFLLPLSHSLK